MKDVEEIIKEWSELLPDTYSIQCKNEVAKAYLEQEKQIAMLKEALEYIADDPCRSADGVYCSVAQEALNKTKGGE